MQRKTLFTLCAATVLASTTALGIVMANPSSRLGSVDWVGETSRDWNTASNWSGNAVPAATDVVIVDPPNPSLNYKGDPILSTGSDGLAGDLTIGGGFTVTVTGKMLTLDGAVTHDFDGDLFLTDGSSKLVFTADATIDGDGKIVGQHDDAKILIDEPSSGANTVTSKIVLEGRMVLKRGVDAAGSAEFVNDTTGKVLANVAGTLRFEDLDLSGAGVWKAETNGSARLEFATADTSGLTGDFTLSHNAEFKFLADITTTGSFTADPRCGDLVFDPNDGTICFEATGNSFSRCTNQTYSTSCP